MKTKEVVVLRVCENYFCKKYGQLTEHVSTQNGKWETIKCKTCGQGPPSYATR